MRHSITTLDGSPERRTSAPHFNPYSAHRNAGQPALELFLALRARPPRRHRGDDSDRTSREEPEATQHRSGEADGEDGDGEEEAECCPEQSDCSHPPIMTPAYVNPPRVARHRQ